MQIELFVFPKLPNLPNASPFCMKLEAYLRMAGLEYQVTHVHDGRRSGTGTNKIPYIKIDGESYSDSGLIIERLEQQLTNPIDGNLTPKQRAESLSIQRLLEEHLYFIIVYSRILDPQGWLGWSKLANEHMGVPKLLLNLAKPLLRMQVKKHLHGQGIGRHKAETIWMLGNADVVAVSDWLDNGPYAFGTNPHVIDSCLAAFTAGVVRMPWEYPLKQAFLRHPNLIAHSERFMNEFFPEYSDGN